MIKKFGYVIAVAGLLSGCAWKGKDLLGTNTEKSEDHKTEGKNETEKVSNVDESSKKSVSRLQDISIAFQWKSGIDGSHVQNISRIFSEKNDLTKNFYLEMPVTLPAVVPNEIELDVQMSKLNPQLDETVIIAIKGDSSDLKLRESSLFTSPDHTLLEQMNDEAHLKLKIQGLREVLSDSEQQKLFITLDVRYSKSSLKLATFYFSLLTPPKRVVLQQMMIHEAQKPIGALEINELVSPAKKLELIQVVKTENNSGENISAEIPVRVSGKLWQKRRYFLPQPGRDDKHYGSLLDQDLCLDTMKEKNLDHTFSENFFILPLNESLKREWISHLTQNLFNLKMLANSEQLLGIFAESTGKYKSLAQELKESKLSEYYTNNLLFSGTKIIETKCDFGCINPDLGSVLVGSPPPYTSQCEDISAEHSVWKSDCEQRVAECLPCIKMGKFPNIPTNTAWSAECNRCHELEITEGFNQMFNYHGRKACDNGWKKKVLETKEVRDGHYAEKVTLDLNNDDIRAFVRFDFSDKKDDPEGRTIEILKSSTYFE